MKKIFSVLIIIAILTLSFTGCKKTQPEEKNTIAVSILPQAEFAQNICGDKMNVLTLIPSGASAENYEPTPKENAKFSSAKIYFTIGIPAEKMGILPNINPNTKVVHLEDYVAETYPDLEINGERDPHIWLSIKRSITMVKTMTKEICTLDPKNKEFYQKNSKNYIEKLTELNSKIKKMFTKKQGKAFLVFHPAFAYFADEYYLKMYALEKHGKEATPKDLTNMVDFAKLKGINTIFCQAETSQKQSRSFAEEIGGKIEILEPLSENFLDNMLKMATLIEKAVK